MEWNSVERMMLGRAQELSIDVFTLPIATFIAHVKILNEHWHEYKVLIDSAATATHASPSGCPKTGAPNLTNNTLHLQTSPGTEGTSLTAAYQPQAQQDMNRRMSHCQQMGFNNEYMGQPQAWGNMNCFQGQQGFGNMGNVGPSPYSSGHDFSMSSYGQTPSPGFGGNMPGSYESRFWNGASTGTSPRYDADGISGCNGSLCCATAITLATRFADWHGATRGHARSEGQAAGQF